ncbi:uncharacterized protein LAESUDRAFT_742984 [Laetiporus sulphureus 93-53]|uniref:histidine kinase n=1 Tax=Laetiporus sulphureus 93-53 TaxID=1314785 RepID=A0A165EKA1_9APHY|nr:uncharacterized protein LAESUDRAFT_742984 [Laetiporus sulphureus 93-53]KZT07233.1 hypothetical protein LAESUDRAFT_742984 [Laetiporus sulphureus 93-53]
MLFHSRGSLATTADGRDEVPLPNIGRSSAEKDTGAVNTAPVNSNATVQPLLPTPVTQPSPSLGRRSKNRKNARVNGGLRVHWAQFKRRIGNGTAPSTSESALEHDDSGDSYRHGYLRHLETQGDTDDEVVDEVVVDREWSDEVKSSSMTHSEHGGAPAEKSSNQLGGTNTDRDSLALQATGFWTIQPLLFLRYRVWPVIHDFFINHFENEKAEMHYIKENWFLRKNLAFWSSAFLIVNWVLAIGFLQLQKPITLADKIFYYGVSPAITFPVLAFVMWDFPRDREIFYQIWLSFATWMWAIYQIILMYIVGYYGSPALLNKGNKDFLTLFYYTSALQTVGLFGLKLNRIPAATCAFIFFIIACSLTLPYHPSFIRNLINFLLFQSFLLYIHYTRENAERRLYTLRDQLKIQFRATQKAQVNERKAADSKRRLTSYVFHEVRVPLNTALLAVQNMEANGSIARSQDIEFNALEGSLSMMSKVLNDVLDFNRMDSGRFEFVLKPYSFHQVMRSMFVPLQLATDARGLEFVTELDKNVDDVARRALYDALGESQAVIDKRIREQPDEDGFVVGDETRLRQIITNLASNACKFTPAGGKLTIRTRLILPQMESPEDNASLDDIGRRPSEESGRPMTSLPPESAQWEGKKYKEGQSPPIPHRLSATHLTQHNNVYSKPPSLEWIVVRIEVSDTGYGIRPKDMVQSKLFSAFNQTEQGRLQGGKGTGLGLALVRQIVKLTGGRLGVKSKVGQGSTFWVELPLGVGIKAIPALMMPAELHADAFGTPSSATRTMPPSCITQADILPDHPELHAALQAQSQGSRSSSALHSIMEQGGLVEISTKRGERSPVLTRTIGDPSTGTHAIVGDITTPTALEPPLLSKDSSSATTRPRLSQLLGPQASSLNPPPSPAPSSAASFTGAGAAGSSAEQEAPLKVLVVDDDPLTRLLMSRMLTRIGCKVATAENGEIALEMILGTEQNGQHATPSSEDTGSTGLSIDAEPPSGDEYRYSVVFLDNQMPVLSGLDLVGRLREMGRRDFVVGVTGNALLSDQQEYLEAGADHVLTKPVLEKSLQSMLAIADERRKQQRASSITEQPRPPRPP